MTIFRWPRASTSAAFFSNFWVPVLGTDFGPQNGDPLFTLQLAVPILGTRFGTQNGYLFWCRWVGFLVARRPPKTWSGSHSFRRFLDGPCVSWRPWRPGPCFGHWRPTRRHISASTGLGVRFGTRNEVPKKCKWNPLFERFFLKSTVSESFFSPCMAVCPHLESGSPGFPLVPETFRLFYRRVPYHR